jgi:hypothetical protein
MIHVSDHYDRRVTLQYVKLAIWPLESAQNVLATRVNHAVSQHTERPEYIYSGGVRLG